MELSELPECKVTKEESKGDNPAHVEVVTPTQILVCDVCMRQDSDKHLSTKYCCTCEQKLWDEHLKVKLHYDYCSSIKTPGDLI